MSREIMLRHEFVEYLPSELADGTMYISVMYSTAIHKCCCGCGNQVVTPFSPTDWKLIFDGETVSLEPSIGNWSFPCRSHYWVRRGKVRWARSRSEEEVETGRERDRVAKTFFFGRRSTAGDSRASAKTRKRPKAAARTKK